MNSTTLRQSIEALYQEAESVTANGDPMLAMVKAVPAKAALHSEAGISAPATSNDDELPLKQRIQELLSYAETEEGKTAAPVQTGTPDATDPDSGQIADIIDLEQDRLSPKVRADVTAIMADIAAAVGVVPDVNSISPHPKNTESEIIAGMDKDALAGFISSTVKAVINEELPKLIRVALATDTTGQRKSPDPANPTEQIINLRPAKKAAAAKEQPVTKKPVTKEAVSRKAAAKTTAAKSVPRKTPRKSRSKTVK